MENEKVKKEKEGKEKEIQTLKGHGFQDWSNSNVILNF